MHFREYAFPQGSASGIERTYSYACRRIRIISGQLVIENFVLQRLHQLVLHNSQRLLVDTRCPNNRSWFDRRAVPIKEKIHELPLYSRAFACLRRVAEEDRAKSIFSFELTHVHSLSLHGAAETDFPDLRNRLDQF